MPKQYLLMRLDWSALRWRRAIARVVLPHQFFTDSTKSPQISGCLFPFAVVVPCRSTRKPHQLLHGQARTTQYLRSLFYPSSFLWNTLSSVIKCVTKSTHSNGPLKFTGTITCISLTPTLTSRANNRLYLSTVVSYFPSFPSFSDHPVF